MALINTNIRKSKTTVYDTIASNFENYNPHQQMAILAAMYKKYITWGNNEASVNDPGGGGGGLSRYCKRHPENCKQKIIDNGAKLDRVKGITSDIASKIFYIESLSESEIGSYDNFFFMFSKLLYTYEPFKYFQYTFRNGQYSELYTKMVGLYKPEGYYFNGLLFDDSITGEIKITQPANLSKKELNSRYFTISKLDSSSNLTIDAFWFNYEGTGVEPTILANNTVEIYLQEGGLTPQTIIESISSKLEILGYTVTNLTTNEIKVSGATIQPLFTVESLDKGTASSGYSDNITLKTSNGTELRLPITSDIELENAYNRDLRSEEERSGSNLEIGYVVALSSLKNLHDPNNLHNFEGYFISTREDLNSLTTNERVSTNYSNNEIHPLLTGITCDLC